MIRSHIITTAALAAGAVVGVTGAGLVRAAGDPFVGMQVLDLLCEEAGGQRVFTPYHIARCQEARASEGVEIPTLVCEGLLEGTFETVPTTGRPSRVNWFCFAGS